MERSSQMHDNEIGLESKREGRNWLPLAIAAAMVIAVVMAAFVLTGKSKPADVPVGAPLDPYAAHMAISNVTMSEATNTVGGKLTYIEGHIANQGSATVAAISMQVIFRNYAGQVAQNQTIPVSVIGMREPYVDIVPLSKSPLAPGGEHEFRLIFDNVSPDWAGALPELRVVGVQTK
jgi:hypothetical protein